MQTIYADGVANVSLVDGVVRLDLVRIVPKAEGDAQNLAVATLALSLKGFLRLQEQVNKATAEMISQGVLKKNEIPPMMEMK